MGNDTETLTLTDFLLERIAEDEAPAHEALARASTHAEVKWHWMRVTRRSSMFEPTNHDPARVLTEAETKRRIMEIHATGKPWCDCGTWDTTVHGEPGYEVCPTLRHLASVYADHPDYREDWRP